MKSRGLGDVYKRQVKYLTFHYIRSWSIKRNGATALCTCVTVELTVSEVTIATFHIHSTTAVATNGTCGMIVVEYTVLHVELALLYTNRQGIGLCIATVVPEITAFHQQAFCIVRYTDCLLYTSDAADDLLTV